MPYKNTLKNENLPNVPIPSPEQPEGGRPSYRTLHISLTLSYIPLTLYKQGNPFVRPTFNLPGSQTSYPVPRSTYPDHPLPHITPKQGNPFVRSQISPSPHVLLTRAEIPAHKRPTLRRDLVIFLPFTVTFNLPCLGYIVISLWKERENRG